MWVRSTDRKMNHTHTHTHKQRIITKDPCACKLTQSLAWHPKKIDKVCDARRNAHRHDAPTCLVRELGFLFLIIPSVLRKPPQLLPCPYMSSTLDCCA
jgi:hypothetical protein